MAKAAIVLLADTETKEGLGRMSNALTTVREFKGQRQEVTLIFDGAGTKWVGELSDPDHKYNRHFESVRARCRGPVPIARGPSASRTRCKRAASNCSETSRATPAWRSWSPRATR